jgi:small subunit ribosomal protein S2
MLTNWNTVSVQIKRLKDLETKMENGQLAAKYNKLEVQRFQEEIDAKELMYGGIKDMPGKPGAVFITDLTHDVNAVREARKLGVPIVALADTNSDPTLADYAIPCNDDAIKTLQMVADYLKLAVQAGVAKQKVSVDKTEA